VKHTTYKTYKNIKTYKLHITYTHQLKIQVKVLYSMIVGEVSLRFISRQRRNNKNRHLSIMPVKCNQNSCVTIGCGIKQPSDCWENCKKILGVYFRSISECLRIWVYKLAIISDFCWNDRVLCFYVRNSNVCNV